MRSYYKKIVTKAHAGVAGIKCTCCRGGLITVKRARIAHNRILRRVSKAAIAYRLKHV